jgi:OOP family OmpA-OmpF porin
MRIQRLIAVAILALGAAGAAQAQSLYVGGSLGGSYWDVDEVAGVSIDESDFAYKIHFGVELSPYLGVEIGWADLGKARFSGSASGDLKGSGAYLDAVGTFPLAEGWGLLGRIGVFNGKAKGTVSGLGSTSDAGTDVKFGVGFEWHVTRQAVVRGEWERYRFDVFGERGDVDLWSVGVNFRF